MVKDDGVRLSVGEELMLVKLDAIVKALVRLEFLGSERLEQLEQEGRERLDGIDRSLLGVVEALQTIAARLDDGDD